jgi:hypothetical protein
MGAFSAEKAINSLVVALKELLPLTGQKIWFVDSVEGSDANKGSDPHNAFFSLKAVSMVAKPEDIIIEIK